jgi:hypothetical protein
MRPFQFATTQQWLSLRGRNPNARIWETARGWVDITEIDSAPPASASRTVLERRAPRVSVSPLATRKSTITERFSPSPPMGGLQMR